MVPSTRSAGFSVAESRSVRSAWWATCLAIALAYGEPTPAAAQIEVAEATIPELQAAMESGRVTSVDVTRAYLARIAAYDRAGPRLNAVIRLNPGALAEAERLDAERAARGPRGPLHGVPVLLKDNYDTFDMPTSAGSLPLAGLVPPDDAFQVRKLREAGAVILGKTNMHELAYGITTIASLGGQTLNPYDPRRNPGGSSGGTGAAIAASFAAVGWGSDTCGSIRIPASHNNLVGLRPTKGLSSIDGIVPLAHTQDVGGPLARTVRDLAIALDATVGADPADPATSALQGRVLPAFEVALDPDALRGARLGILTALWGDTPEDAAVASVMRDAVARMAELGADTTTVEVADYQSLIAGSSVIQHEFKWDLQDYLASVPGAPVASLEQMLEKGLNHEALVPTLERSTTPESRDSDAYRRALAKREPLRNAVVAALDAGDLDALVYPTIRSVANLAGEPQRGSNCQISASTGLPAISVPAGFFGDLPVGVELLGRPFDDARLVALAYALEQGTESRRAPRTVPPLVAGRAPGPVTTTVQVGGGGAGAGSGASGHARVALEYDPVLGTLAWDVQVAGTAPSDVYAVVLRHANEDGGWSVVARLTGPGVTAERGTLALDGEMRARLEASELHVALATRADPFGAQGVQVSLR
jgi:Asp-tRNA(Asn)/Glu-tRNA(Gln) amidotransferase A subunit family amidase